MVCDRCKSDEDVRRVRLRCVPPFPNPTGEKRRELKFCVCGACRGQLLERIDAFFAAKPQDG